MWLLLATPFFLWVDGNHQLLPIVQLGVIDHPGGELTTGRREALSPCCKRLLVCLLIRQNAPE